MELSDPLWVREIKKLAKDIAKERHEQMTQEETGHGKANLFATSPDGFRCHFEIPDGWIQDILDLEHQLVTHGFTPDTGRGSPPVQSAPVAAPEPRRPAFVKQEPVAPQGQDVCPHHGTQAIKPSKFGGVYCGGKMGDGTWCQWKAA